MGMTATHRGGRQQCVCVLSCLGCLEAHVHANASCTNRLQPAAAAMAPAGSSGGTGSSCGTFFVLGLTDGKVHHRANYDEGQKGVDEVACSVIDNRRQGLVGNGGARCLTGSVCTATSTALASTADLTLTVLEDGPIHREGEVIEVAAAPDGADCKAGGGWAELVQVQGSEPAGEQLQILHVMLMPGRRVNRGTAQAVG